MSQLRKGPSANVPFIFGCKIVTLFKFLQSLKVNFPIFKAAKMLNIPVNFVEMDKLTLFKSEDIHESEFVKSKFGVGSVSEASALITAGFDSKLIYKKTAFDGVTIALAVSKKD